MTTIIFGISGQDGYYLNQLLQKENCKVIGISKKDGIDIFNYNHILKLIEQSKPDYIFHLAANSSTKHE